MTWFYILPHTDDLYKVFYIILSGISNAFIIDLSSSKTFMTGLLRLKEFVEYMEIIIIIKYYYLKKISKITTLRICISTYLQEYA